MRLVAFLSLCTALYLMVTDDVARRVPDPYDPRNAVIFEEGP